MTGTVGRGAISRADEARFRDALAAVSPHQGRFEYLMRGLIRLWCRAVGWHTHVVHRAALPEVGGVPGAGCVVVAAPHRAWIDPFLLLSAWPRDAARLVWLADGRTVTRSRWRRRLLPRLGVIPIGGGGPRVYAELAAQVLSTGHALAVFPEVGAPSPPDRARPVSSGFAYLALRSRAPIIPVVIGGTHRIVRGSSFSVDVLSAITVDRALEDPFVPDGREQARILAARYAADMATVLPGRTAEADAHAPMPERWRWLGKLFG